MYIIILLFLHGLHHVLRFTTQILIAIHHYTHVPNCQFAFIPPHFPSGNQQSNLCLYVFIFCCYYLLLNEWDHTVFFDNMDGHWGYYAKWNKPEGEGQVPYDLHIFLQAHIKKCLLKGKWVLFLSTKMALCSKHGLGSYAYKLELREMGNKVISKKGCYSYFSSAVVMIPIHIETGSSTSTYKSGSENAFTKECEITSQGSKRQ